jgi:broad specificity phosphatase PhoE
MNEVTRIFVVRHGESEHNAQKRISGHANPKLTDKGRQQARQARVRLKNIKFDVVYSSPLDRAVETAEIITGQPVPEENRRPELRERHWGSLDGKPDKHLESGNRLKKDLSYEEVLHYKYVPDMESDHEVSARFISALEEIAKQNPGKTILVAAHGGAIRTTILKLSGLLAKYSQPYAIKNADVLELDFVDDKLRALRLNDEAL